MRVFLMRNRREVHMFHLASEMGKFVHVLPEKKVTLWWLMNSNIVKPGKFGHLNLVYHFTISLAKCFDARNNFFVRSKWLFYRICEKIIICFSCRCNTFFNLLWHITEKVVKYICYLLFFWYQLSIIVDVPNFLGVFLLLMLIISLIPS